MERISMQQKHTKHIRIAKKKPLKVIYISNPMKFTTSADQFRTIVQQLTGMDSNIDDFANHASRVSTSDLPDNYPNFETNDGIMHQQQHIGSEQLDYASNGYLYDDFAGDFEIFGDLSSICYESMLCSNRPHDHVEAK